jgi:hypothetical protein
MPTCTECDLSFSRPWNYKRHIALKHTLYTVKDDPWQLAILETLKRLEEPSKGPFMTDFFTDLQQILKRWTVAIDAFVDLSKTIETIQ